MASSTSETPTFELNFSKSETSFLTDTYLFKYLTLSDLFYDLVSRIFALTLLILLSPLLILVALAIKVFMPGNVFYLQTRVGKNGQNFSIYKFRTMIANAEAITGPVLATKNDPRITKLGKFLRASHIDEFPQLFNVILGDMAFVCPRPERPEFVDVFDREIPKYIRRKEVKPGITGLAQICLPYDATADQKIKYDVFYIDHKDSIVFNLLICWFTFLKMVYFKKFV